MTEKEYAEILRKIDYIILVDYIDEQREKEEMIETNVCNMPNKSVGESCRNCDFAYLRTEQTSHYQYEACALGVVPFQRFLVGCCKYHKVRTSEVPVVNVVPKLILGRTNKL